MSLSRGTGCLLHTDSKACLFIDEETSHTLCKQPDPVHCVSWHTRGATACCFYMAPALPDASLIGEGVYPSCTPTPGKVRSREIWDFPDTQKGHMPSESAVTESPVGQAWNPKDGVVQCSKSPLWGFWGFRNVFSLSQGVVSGELPLLLTPKTLFTSFADLLNKDGAVLFSASTV